ncbi:MAG: RNA polymerase sigma-70 factor [Bacteroidota bacterium]
MSLTDKELLQALRFGSERAYRQLFDEHYERMVAIAHRVAPDPDQARECAQQVLVRVFEQRESLQVRGSLRAYLNRAVLNTALNQHKQQQRVVSMVPEDTEALAPDHQDLLEAAEEEARIWQEIKALPDQCRKIFLMNRFEGYSNAEIADQLQLSKRSVETQISIALKKLRNNLMIFIGLGI